MSIIPCPCYAATVKQSNSQKALGVLGGARSSVQRLRPSAQVADDRPDGPPTSPLGHRLEYRMEFPKLEAHVIRWPSDDRVVLPTQTIEGFL